LRFHAAQRFTEISIVVLLVGTLVGGFVQTGEIFSTAALSYAPDTVPDWIQARSGSFLMVLAVLFIVFPASLVEVMTQARAAPGAAAAAPPTGPPGAGGPGRCFPSLDRLMRRLNGQPVAPQFSDSGFHAWRVGHPPAAVVTWPGPQANLHHTFCKSASHDSSLWMPYPPGMNAVMMELTCSATSLVDGAGQGGPCPAPATLAVRAWVVLSAVHALRSKAPSTVHFALCA